MTATVRRRSDEIRADHLPRARAAARVDVRDVEHGVPGRLRHALLDLRRAGPAGDELVAVREALRDLVRHHRRRPRTRPDEAHVAAEDVPDLRQLVEVARLQEPAPGPRQVRLVGLVQAGVRLRPGRSRSRTSRRSVRNFRRSNSRPREIRGSR